MKPYLFFLLVLGFSISNIGHSEELIKIGTYDFQNTMKEMSDEPFLRQRFPKALGAPLFVALILQDQVNQANPPSKNDWGTQADNYGNYFIKSRLSEIAQQWAQSNQKSGKMKDDLILGLSLAQQYRGFSIILKSEEGILYSDTDLNSSIASVLADYLSKNPQNTSSIDEETDETVDSVPIKEN